MLFVAIGMIGATVMAHNLFLTRHCAVSEVQKGQHSVRNAIRFNTIDSTFALTIAFRQCRDPVWRRVFSR